MISKITLSTEVQLAHGERDSRGIRKRLFYGSGFAMSNFSLLNNLFVCERGKDHGACVGGWGMHDTVLIGRSKDNFVEVFLSFHLSVGSRN